MHPVINQLTATRGAGAAWTPAQLSNQVGWWRASDITGKSDGDSVTAWPDSYGLLSDATGTGTYRTGGNGIGGQPAIEFNGSTNSYATGYTGTPTDFFVWSVWDWQSITEFERIFNKDGKNGFTCFRLGLNDQLAMFGAGSNDNTFLFLDFEATYGQPAYSLQGRSATTYTVEANTLIASGTVASSPITSAELVIGGLSNLFGGLISEVGVLTAYPSAGDLTNLRSYITSTYGIATS